VLLRWKVGPAEYVETTEHRLAAGLPAADVHHVNADKADNDPGNLEPLSHSAHARHHGAELTAKSRATTQWDGARSQATYDKRQRAAQRRREYRDRALLMAAAYREGRSTTEISATFGLSAGGVSVALRSVGVAMRPRPGQHAGLPLARQRTMGRDQMQCQRCARSVKWRAKHVHHRKLRSQGGPDTGSNLVLMCDDCHGWCHAGGSRAAAERAGYIVPSWAEPRRVPMWSEPRGAWVLLDDEYGIAAEAPGWGGLA
jgi:hypothetical protein